MKLFYHRTSLIKPSMGDDCKYRIVFACAQPVVIQPGEIKKVPTGLILRVEPGTFLTIYTAPWLWQRAAEVFPAALVLDHTAPETPFEIPIRNAGRSQLNILSEQVIAWGIGITTETLELEEFQPNTVSIETKNSRPQRKNPDVRFEIK